EAAVRSEAISKFGSCQSAAATTLLIHMLSDPAAIVRRDAAFALSKRKEETRGVRQALERVLEKDEEQVRWAAACALASLDGERSQVARFTPFLRSKDTSLRVQAAWALVNMGPRGRAALPVLVELLEDRSALTRAGTLRLFPRLGREARAAVPALVKCLK